jgi:peptidoglycan hydrolase-like protein with peptidoglycan-binding domain
MLCRECGGSGLPLNTKVRPGIVPAHEKGVYMKKVLAVLALGAMLVVPLAAIAASSSNERIPAAVDQLLARDMIQQAQMQLKVAGYDPGRVDGIFDEQTSAALRKFQASRGLPASGLLDEPTRRVIFVGLQDSSDD